MSDTAHSSVAVLLSGGGSNLEAMLAAQVPVKLVVSDCAHAVGVSVARQARLNTVICEHAAFHDRAGFEAALQTVLDVNNPTIIALAGFMRILSGAFVTHFAGRLVNIHPSLLPALPGLNTHQRVLDHGSTEHGCTVHWVTEKVDAGPIISQQKVKIQAGDDAAILGKRVRLAEHALYPQVLHEILQGQALQA